jgi:hypothetical protein
MKKTWIVAILLVVALVIAGLVILLVSKEKGQNDLLAQEINALSESNTNTEVKTTGQYGIVEKLIKEDYKLYIESIATLRANYEKLAAAKVINLDTYQKDGPEFEESLGLLKGIKEENAELISKLEDMVDEAKIEEVIQANGLEARFADMYKDILGQIKLADGIASLKETDAKYDAYNDSLIAVLEYMKENKNEWFIENNTLKSKSQNFIDEYNDLVKKTNVEL